MITVDALATHISGRLSNVQPVIPGVLRGERSGDGGVTYAVYYFALSSDLRDWAEHLEERQDEIIGPSYFKAPGDLRWNHYLYLLTSKEATSGASYNDHKRTIESDRSYARKFVLTEDELSDTLKMLEPPRFAQQGAVGPDVVGRWTKRLLQERLSIVLDQLPLTETVRLIAKEAATDQQQATEREASPRIAQPLATKFLDAIEIIKFRKWPANQVFDSLGTVNLIVGTNGVGKTSLLEAIEYLYCQENVRTSAPLGAHVKARLKGMATWQEMRSTVKTAEAKQRNLDWYGQRDLKGSTLPNSFARFNFLSTDEAAVLGQKNAKVSFEDMLSRLVAGPQAAELWDHLSRLRQPLAAERLRLQTIVEDAKQRKMTLEALIKEAAAGPHASDTDLSSLAEDLSRLGWMSPVSRETVASQAVPVLTKASSIVRELMAARLSLASISHKTVTEAHRSAEATSVEVRLLLEQLSELEIKATDSAVDRQALLQMLRNIESIKIAQQSNAFEVVEELDRLQQEIRHLRTLIGSENLPSEVPVWMAELMVPLTEVLASTLRQSATLGAEVASLESHLETVRKTQDSTTSILVEVRALARQLFAHSPGHTNCPVCATKFSVGELEHRLAQAQSEVSTDQTTHVLSALLAMREQKSEMDARCSVLNDLASYARRCGLEQSWQFPRVVLLDFLGKNSSFDSLQRQHADTSLRLSKLGTSGLDYESVKSLQKTASYIGVDVLRQGAVDEAFTNKTAELQQHDVKAQEHASERAILTSRICFAIRGVHQVAEPLDNIVNAFHDRLALLSISHSLIDELHQLFKLDTESNIAAIAPLLDSAKASAERFARALQNESASRASEATAREQIIKVDERIILHEGAERRVQHAISVLSEIESEDSLLASTDAELLNAQIETDAIFRRIHSPHEYGVQRNAQAPLYRLDNIKQAVTLRDVSTGQRAAFVLSVFLAMNAKLKTSPPVLLFDDPVAHIDDFNALSFLDHLRDVAIEGQRQIFYATADSRLAGLFEHKFSFMGDKFRRFDLVR